MKRVYVLLVVFFVQIIADPAYSQFVSKEQAQQIAQNWILMIIDKYGQWGESDSAEALPMQDFTSEGRLIGYYCQVRPQGFIVVSLRRELAPVKAYCDRYTLNPISENGMTDLIKTSMRQTIDTIERRLGKIDTIDHGNLSAIIQMDYLPAWEFITGYIPGMIQEDTTETDNYQEGEVLLTSMWHQGPPYNNWCPYLGCTTTSNGRALVGCVATAGSQIMKYWSWPPYGAFLGWADSYDWPNMVDNATTSSPSVVQEAVAELSSEVGIAVGMSYGCDASGAVTSDMVGVYVNYFYYHNSCTYTHRKDHTSEGFDYLLTWNLNINRPLQYRVVGHSIVCDGWQDIGSPAIRQYHMNYGWADGATTWYTLNELIFGNFWEEYIVLYIVPTTAMGAGISGTYASTTLPRYFDLDASGSSATFNSGHLLQILPEITITGTGTSSYIRFYGAPGQFTRIFTDGILSKGIAIKDGCIRLRSNGSIKLE